ncbi:DUF4126 family protein [Streptomyces sp. NBC_01754]|uniref:DUF4126 family protein n=1 Tax=Streptomyces sp. NBC_01754 TaxID=2975930 RepID=UPI002DD98D9B|nr:DUF4126 family protein [Streptomyces sp. NBC_01754]WSC95422.1 DUF4126 family protein [Streptomyces sp. NBC_01754]
MRPVGDALARAALIGAVTGLRSQWGIAAVSWTVRPAAAASSVTQQLLARPWVRGSVLVTAVGEFVADKSPRAPSRLTPGGLVPRVVLGALSGMALAERERPMVPPAAAAAAGATAAYAFALAGVRWRRTAGVPADAVAAAVEDVLAMALAWVACARGDAACGPPARGGGEGPWSGRSATGPRPGGPIHDDGEVPGEP